MNVVEKFSRRLMKERLKRKVRLRTDLVRLGTDYGGWHVPQSVLTTDAICYCAGAGEDISFDCALIKQFGCAVYSFDPTPRVVAYIESLKTGADHGAEKPEDSLSGAHVAKEIIDKLVFSPIGVWSRSEKKKFYEPRNKNHVSCSILNLQNTEDFFEAQCHSLKDIMATYQHGSLCLLKLDIEGAEYEVLTSMISDNIQPQILCVEFDEWHLPKDKKYRKRIQEMIRKIENAGYDIVHVDDQLNMTFLARNQR